MAKNNLSITNAYDLLEHAKNQNIEIGAPVNLSEIAKLLGVSVFEDYELEGSDIIGQITFDGEQAVITINPFQNNYEPRRRFTLAHELGHFCLHATSQKTFTDSRKTMSRSGSYWDKYESEANNFAAQLLMPKDLLVAEGKKLISIYKAEESAQTMPAKIFIEQMSSLFEVSSKAMEYRLKNIGVIKY